LLISGGKIESGEMTPPAEHSPAAAFEHLQVMTELTDVLRTMPGADAVRLKPVSRPQRLALRLAIAVGILVALAALMIHAKSGANLAIDYATEAPSLNGIDLADAARIPGVSAWAVAKQSDFDPAALTWLRNYERQPEGRIEGKFCAGQDGVAYLLVARKQQSESAGAVAGTNRLVVLCGGENVYDSKYKFIGLVARVPRESMVSINWLAPPSERHDSDGLLITRSPNDPESGLILILDGRRVISGVPRNYQLLRAE
jgi:hypothetical protein